jgi:hypothetical protein
VLRKEESTLSATLAGAEYYLQWTATPGNPNPAEMTNSLEVSNGPSLKVLPPACATYKGNGTGCAATSAATFQFSYTACPNGQLTLPGPVFKSFSAPGSYGGSTIIASGAAGTPVYAGAVGDYPIVSSSPPIGASSSPPPSPPFSPLSPSPPPAPAAPNAPPSPLPISQRGVVAWLAVLTAVYSAWLLFTLGNGVARLLKSSPSPAPTTGKDPSTSDTAPAESV